jgi:osmotically-inducible protein OsmY
MEDRMTITSLPAIRVGMPVDGRDGPLGTVAGTRAAPTADRTPYVLVRTARLFGLVRTTRLVPLAWVLDAPAAARRVLLDASRAQVAGCPPLREDDTLRRDVAQALLEAPRPFRVGAIRVTVRDGIAELTGHAPVARDRDHAVASARAVPGVLEVQDHTVDDGALVIAVAQALTQDPVTSQAHLVVGSQLGEITLSGTLPTAAAVGAAAALALAVPGVTGVHDSVTVPAEENP